MMSPTLLPTILGGVTRSCWLLEGRLSLIGMVRAEECLLYGFACFSSRWWLERRCSNLMHFILLMLTLHASFSHLVLLILVSINHVDVHHNKRQNQHRSVYRQHFASDLPLRLMDKMLIGHLHPTDQLQIDTAMDNLTSTTDDPYEHEPHRSPLLLVHSDTPMNAEVPSDIITKEYITPVGLFYIRHHHPVPLLSEEEVKEFRLEVDLSLLDKSKSGGSSGDEDGDTKQTAKLSLKQIQSLPKVEVTTTLQCSGNRRSGFNDLRRTSGTPWGQGAISTAKWGGARLVDVLMLAAEQQQQEVAAASVEDGIDGNAVVTKKATKKKGKKRNNNSKGKKGDDPSLLKTLQNLQTLLQDHPTLQHLRMESLDGMLASIDILKALSPFGDVILAYEMNDEALPRDHGYPLRVIVPGYAAVRNVKWVSRLELSNEEAVGAWQRGLNYKVLPPAVVDAKNVDLDGMPGLGEVSVFSGITDVERVGDEGKKMVPGETVLVKASGWAWAG